MFNHRIDFESILVSHKSHVKYKVTPHNQTHIINSTHIQSLARILNLNREENEIYVSDSHKSRREREFFLQNLENREEKENENSIFSSERERSRSVFLEISRDSRLLSMSGGWLKSYLAEIHLQGLP